MNRQFVVSARATLLGALGLLAALPVQAGSITLGELYQESTSLTASNPPTTGACNSQQYCYLVFRKVPAGKQLIVRQVSCQISVSTAADVTQMFLQTRLSNGFDVAERFQFLIPGTRPSTTPGVHVVTNENAYQLYSQGQRPEIYLQVDTASSFNGFCTISGELANAPPPA